MAAIAYVTDEKMLDYHRINGSHSIVFWRLSSKKFSDFKPGDLLFFLAKDNKVRKKEKGLVGYGVYQGESSMSLNSVWKKYGTQTGYNSKEEFTEAIVRSCKSEQLPKKLSCLMLDKVVFFASPIYFSDIGYSVSNKLESFMYLQSDKENLTLKILNTAQEIGLDSWSLMQNDHLNEDLFHQQLLKYRLLTIIDEIGNHSTVPPSLAKQAYEADEAVDKMWITQNYQYYISFGEQNIINCLYYTNTRNEKDNFYRFVGLTMMLRSQIKNQIEEAVEVRIIALSKISEEQEELFKQQGIAVSQL